MADRFPSLLVVGPVSDSLLGDFERMLVQDGVLPKPESFLCENGTYMIQYDAMDGRFRNTEIWLYKNNISYDVEHQGSDGVLPTYSSFRTGKKYITEHITDGDGHVLLTEDDIQFVIGHCDDIDDFLYQLKEYCSIRPLPRAPFVSAPLSSISLKQKNSDPSSTDCAKCGGPLRSPFPGLKHCPVCEP